MAQTTKYKKSSGLQDLIILQLLTSTRKLLVYFYKTLDIRRDSSLIKVLSRGRI